MIARFCLCAVTPLKNIGCQSHICPSLFSALSHVSSHLLPIYIRITLAAPTSTPLHHTTRTGRITSSTSSTAAPFDVTPTTPCIAEYSISFVTRINGKCNCSSSCKHSVAHSLVAHVKTVGKCPERLLFPVKCVYRIARAPEVSFAELQGEANRSWFPLLLFSTLSS